MPKFKGSGIEATRKIVKSRGPEFERKFLAKLKPGKKDIFINALPISWIDIQDDPGDVEALADLLYPLDPDGLKKVGALIATELFSGIYSFFLRIPSLSYVIKHFANVWRSSYDTGEVFVEKKAERTVEVVIKNFPELPSHYLDLLMGNFEGVAKLVGVKQINVSADRQDPSAWKINLHWE